MISTWKIVPILREEGQWFKRLWALPFMIQVVSANYVLVVDVVE